MTEVFISFSPFDEKLVQPIIQGLHERYPNICFARPLGVRPEFFSRDDIQKGMIVEHIRAADCVIVCWSLSSLRDEPVLSDARIAKELGKLIPVLINPLMPDHFPKDLRPADAANLATWNGDYDDEKWRDFRNRVVSKIAEVEAKQGKAVSSPGRRIYSTKTELDEATAAKNVDDGKKQGKKVFICYRRDDSAGSAGRVKDRLEKEFGSDLLFMDVDAILYGGVRLRSVPHAPTLQCGAHVSLR